MKTVNWFIPDIDSPFYGGINTALRIADQLAREHGVENRFVVWGSPPDHFVRSALAAAFSYMVPKPGIERAAMVRIGPAEIESCLVQHPAVANAATATQTTT